MGRVTGIRNVAVGNSFLRAALATLKEALRDPLGVTVLWSEIPYETRAFDQAPEAKSYDPANPEGTARRVRTRDGAPPGVTKGPARVSPTFKLVLLAVLGLTGLAGIGEVVMAVAWPAPTELQQSVFETVATSWKIGFGAVVGLLGGKATR